MSVEDLIRSKLQSEEELTDQRSSHVKATLYYDWPPFSPEYQSADCNVQR